MLDKMESEVEDIMKSEVEAAIKILKKERHPRRIT